MTRMFPAAKKLAGLAAMAVVVTGAGWGLGAGMAQADTKAAPHPHPVLVRNHNFENSPLDRFLDRFFNDDAKKQLR